jgi:hypothetical protein
MMRKLSWMAGCALALALTSAGSASPADPPKASPNPSLSAYSVLITEVSSALGGAGAKRGQEVTVTLENVGTTDADVVVHWDRQFGHLGLGPNAPSLTTKVTVKAKSKATAKQPSYWFTSSICDKKPSFDVNLTGATAGLDTRVRHATHPGATFKTDNLVLQIGGYGVPPPADTQVKVAGASVEGEYACGSKVKMKVRIKNATAKAAPHLNLVLFDDAEIGPPPGPKIGETPVKLLPNSDTDFLVVTSAVASGRGGSLTIRLEDPSNELGSSLGYWRAAQLDVVETTNAAWKLE